MQLSHTWCHPPLSPNAEIIEAHNASFNLLDQATLIIIIPLSNFLSYLNIDMHCKEQLLPSLATSFCCSHAPILPMQNKQPSKPSHAPEEESPSEDDGGDGNDDSDDSEGMASHLDRILEGPPRGDVNVPRTGSPKEGLGRSHRPRADTPPAPMPSRAVPHPQPPPAPKAGGRAKPQATGPLTRGRTATSEKGETGRRSASPGARQVGDAGPRPAPAREGPGASTRGGSRPAGRGTGRRAVLPVG